MKWLLYRLKRIHLKYIYDGRSELYLFIKKQNHFPVEMVTKADTSFT
jgi:hypothetical protein